MTQSHKDDSTPPSLHLHLLTGQEVPLRLELRSSLGERIVNPSLEGYAERELIYERALNELNHFQDLLKSVASDDSLGVYLERCSPDKRFNDSIEGLIAWFYLKALVATYVTAVPIALIRVRASLPYAFAAWLKDFASVHNIELKADHPLLRRWNQRRSMKQSLVRFLSQSAGIVSGLLGAISTAPSIPIHREKPTLILYLYNLDTAVSRVGGC